MITLPMLRKLGLARLRFVVLTKTSTASGEQNGSLSPPPKDELVIFSNQVSCSTCELQALLLGSNLCLQKEARMSGKNDS